MPTMIRVGTTFVNLDRVTHAIGGSAVISVYFSDSEEDYVSFRGDDAAAVYAYLSSQAMDVVGFHQAALKECRDVRDRKAASDANLALLMGCSGPMGHLWEWSEEAEAIVCLHCGANGGERGMYELMDVYGGRISEHSAVPR